MEAAAIIVAAGSGSRAAAAGADRPKQYCLLAGAPVLTASLRAFASHARIGAVIAVIRGGDEHLYAEAAAQIGPKLLPPALGGSTRQQSVLYGLRALRPLGPIKTLIHDAARPFVAAAVIDRTLDAIEAHAAAIAATPVADTLKRADADGLVAGAVDRDGLWAAQTPQGFLFPDILEAHEAAAAAGLSHFTDDAALIEWRGGRVALIEGSADNWKITTAEDLARARRFAERTTGMETRIGSGFDVHGFEPGDHVTLCGVRIPHEARLSGHSDADAALHALTDALLGTIGAGDIGDHFPPSDERWRGADSAIFLDRARELVLERGGRIVNVDITILAERPKIAPHRDAMRARVAALLGLPLDRVGLKATTMERLGFIGRREGIAAMASASVAFAQAWEG